MRTLIVTTSSFGKTDPSSRTLLEKHPFEVIYNPFGRKMTEDEVLALIEEVQPVGMIAGVEPLTRRVLTAATNLKVISRCGIGMDSVDLDAAKRLGMVVTNTPDAPTQAVAELVLGMMLDLCRGISIMNQGIHAGQWKRIEGRLLSKATVGVIGFGRIGSRLAALLAPMTKDLRIYDVDASTAHDKRVTLDTLLAESDIVTLHVPYSAQTRHLMNRETIARMKPGACLVNASRGGLVDEAALYDALKSGSLRGAALDCFEQEPYDGPLAKLPNVLMTAHAGSCATESRSLMESQSVENLIRELAVIQG